MSQLRLVCVRILGVELTRVSLHYEERVSTTLHAALGLFTQEKFIEAKYTHKKFNLLNFTIIFTLLSPIPNSMSALGWHNVYIHVHVPSPSNFFSRPGLTGYMTSWWCDLFWPVRKSHVKCNMWHVTHDIFCYYFLFCIAAIICTHHEI